MNQFEEIEERLRHLHTKRIEGTLKTQYPQRLDELIELFLRVIDKRIEEEIRIQQEYQLSQSGERRSKRRLRQLLERKQRCLQLQ